MEPQNANPTEHEPCTVRLGLFEGPLDLLLHLIKKSEIEITDIPIGLITEQYLEYLKVMKVLNLDVAGDYLLMASTLLHIKSKMLLPVPPEEEVAEEDPRAELVQRLLDYQKYKEASLEIERRPMQGRDVFVRPITVEEEEKEEEKMEVSLFDLLEAFRQILERAREKTVHEVTLDSVTVEQKFGEIRSLLQRQKRSMLFHDLFSSQSSRRIIVITFLAILELVKMKFVRIFQVAPFESIRLSSLERPSREEGEERIEDRSG
jgi:segregation and condensation protein A